MLLSIYGIAPSNTSLSLSRKRNAFASNTVSRLRTIHPRYKFIQTKMNAESTSIVKYEPKKEPENESVKRLTLVSMLFSKLTIYTIVRDTKDVLLVTSCGAEAIPFMKTWFNFPLSILSIVYFSYLSNKGLNNKWIYRCIYIPIAVLYSVVGLILYPNRNLIQPSFLVDGSFFYPVLSTVANNWVVALYYSLASIWGSVIISLLFWMIANEYTDVESAKKIYPLFGFIANFALIFSGSLMTKLNVEFAHDWGTNMKVMMFVVLGFCVINYVLFEYLVNRFQPINLNYRKPSSKKASLRESMINMFKEPFIRNMVFVIASYGSCIAIYETCWKQYMYLYFPSPTEYSKFVGSVTFIKGICTMVMMVASSFLIKNMKFKHSLLVTPVTLSLIGAIFYYAILTKMEPVYIVYIGAIMGICTKSLKYSFFDPNKEIAYIPMSQEIKTKGKATIEVISNPLGKSGSSLVLQFLIITFGSLVEALPAIAFYFSCVCLVWIHVANEIAKERD